MMRYLWLLPLFALVAPLIAALFVLLGNIFGLGGMLHYRLGEAYVKLVISAPVLGLVTLAILLVQYSLFGEELQPMRMRRTSVAVLAGLAVVSPVWLFVIGFVFLGFSR